MKPKVVVILLVSILLLSAGYWLYINRETMRNLTPPPKTEAPKTEAPKTEAPNGTAPPSNIRGSDGRVRRSFEILSEDSKGTQPPANANKYYFTDEQARRMGLRKYRSGPCAGYYEGEEWACNPGHTK